MLLKLIFVIVLVVFDHPFSSCASNDDQAAKAQMLADKINEQLLVRNNVEAVANWNYESNITDHNHQIALNISADNAKYAKVVAKQLKQYNYDRFQDDDLKRKFKLMSDLDDAVLPDAAYEELYNAVSAMEQNYAKVKICDFKNRTKCDLSLEPELSEIVSSSKDPAELKYYWMEWYNKAGLPTKNDFLKYMALSQQSAELNGFRSKAEAWLDKYEDPTFEQQIESTVKQLMPLYEQLHAYARFKLVEKYGKDEVSEKGPIPMHLTGNLWSQQWDAIADFTMPYPEKPLINITNEMIKQNYTALRMFQMGDDFFRSLNMTALPQTFWDKSIIEKPSDGRDIVCHASAWDFYSPKDVRIKQCTRITMDHLATVHHELGHIQYFLQYQHLPIIYRDGANPGFHEAIGDAIALSITPKHLNKIGLLNEVEVDDKSRLNELYKMGLSKVMFLPSAYVFDKYRWQFFRGQINDTQYNCKFWQLREQFCGVTPPVVRTEDNFDAPAKYHISANVEYLRYFVSYVIQFQFHKALCIKAGEYIAGDPEKTLDNCDIYQSFEAGSALKKMLSLGSSKPWPEAMKVLTGDDKMDAGALLEYFKPLENWLIETNKKNGVLVGWEPSGNYQC